MTAKTNASSPGAKLTLIGAGPGDPELLTLKAYQVLQKAELILYDALLHPDVLDYAPAGTIRRFVGKRAGAHTYTQAEINAMIVKGAQTHGHVVRLKGGDPFVFGRGYEEIHHAASHGIETAVIPGVSSATSLTALQKMPLTARGKNKSFWVLTGCTADRTIPDDIYLAAQTDATAVILMGLRKIEQIMTVYEKAGQSELPAAVIVNGSLADETVITGQVNTLAQKVQSHSIQGPALIVIGEAVNCYAASHRHSFQTKHAYSL